MKLDLTTTFIVPTINGMDKTPKKKTTLDVKFDMRMSATEHANANLLAESHGISVGELIRRLLAREYANDGRPLASFSKGNRP